MPERVHRNLFAKVQLGGDDLHRVLRRRGCHRSLGGRHASVLTTIGEKQKAFVSMREPMLSQQLQRRAGDRDVAIFGPFAAMNMDQSAIRIDVTDLQVQSFAQSQSHRIDGPEVNRHALTRTSVNDLVNLLGRDDFRQGLGTFDFQLMQCVPVARTGDTKKELEGRE